MRKWRGCELLYLSAHYATMPLHDIAKALDRGKCGIKTKATLLGLRRPDGKKKWTDADNERVRLEYPKGDLQALADELGATVRKLYQHAMAIGVKRDSEMAAECGRRLVASGTGAAFRFKKGQVSHNKGKKQHEFMSPEQIENTKATRFRPGQETHNRVPIGTERTTRDGYVEVKVRDMADAKNWKLKQRLVYEEKVGPIPEGYIVEFIDGVRTNFEPDNLRCVSRRENAENNRLKDPAILSRFFGIKDPADVAYWIENHSDLIELKRKEMQLNGALLRAKKKNYGKR